MCDCEKFTDLELIRAAIDARIRSTPRLRRRLTFVASSGEHGLLRCPDCAQLWQCSNAWNWGDRLYAFRVPDIRIDEWTELPYVQPDELLTFQALTERVRTALQPASDADPCDTEGCGAPRVRFSIHCARHHMQSLQRIGQLPQDPMGRWFGPYAGS